MNKAELQTKADELFKLHPSLEVLHLTSDGSGFSDENKHRAEAYAQTLTNTKVVVFNRDEEATAETKTQDTNTLDREALALEYEALFGSAPGHNWKAETIKAKIDEKTAAINSVPVIDPETV